MEAMAAADETPPSAQRWDLVYGDRGPSGVSWYQARPVLSLRMIEALAPSPGDAVIDVGGGASGLAGALVSRGFGDVTVLDVSSLALRQARLSLGEEARQVQWVEHDLLTWQPDRRYGLWHDRAVFHFLVNAGDRARYRDVLRAAVRPGGGVVVPVRGILSETRTLPRGG